MRAIDVAFLGAVTLSLGRMFQGMVLDEKTHTNFKIKSGIVISTIIILLGVLFYAVKGWMEDRKEMIEDKKEMKEKALAWELEDRLKELNEQLDRGVITQKEYEQKKKKWKMDLKKYGFIEERIIDRSPEEHIIRELEYRICPSCRDYLNVKVIGFDEEKMSYQCAVCGHKWIGPRDLS